MPWKRGKILVWDATCSDTLAPSQRDIAVREPGAVAAAAEHRKRAKYSHLDATHHFVPLAVESLGVLGHEARAFLRDLARRLTSFTDDQQSHQFLLQRVAVAIQRGNAAAVLGTIGVIYGELIYIFFKVKYNYTKRWAFMHVFYIYKCFIVFVVCFWFLIYCYFEIIIIIIIFYCNYNYIYKLLIHCIHYLHCYNIMYNTIYNYIYIYI